MNRKNRAVIIAGYAIMGIAGALLIATIAWFFTLPLPITDTHTIDTITNTAPWAIGTLVFTGGILITFGLLGEMGETTSGDSEKS
jgi:hypothetical protein